MAYSGSFEVLWLTAQDVTSFWIQKSILSPLTSRMVLECHLDPACLSVKHSQKLPSLLRGSSREMDGKMLCTGQSCYKCSYMKEAVPCKAHLTQFQVLLICFQTESKVLWVGDPERHFLGEVRGTEANIANFSTMSGPVRSKGRPLQTRTFKANQTFSSHTHPRKRFGVELPQILLFLLEENP